MEVPGRKIVDHLSLPSSGDEMDILVKCSKHKGETVRFYCRKHEIVGCGDCMIPDHSACAPESIKNLSKNFQQSGDFQTFVREFDKLTAENKKHEHTVRENKRINKTMLNKALGDIRKFRTDVNKHLDKMEADIISEAKQIFSDNDEVLTKLEQECNVLSSKVEEMKNMLNTAIYQDNLLFINSVECKPRLSEMGRTVTHKKSKGIKQIEFVRDGQLQNCINSGKQFGTLTMPTTVLRRQSSRKTETKTEQTVKSESRSACKTETTVKGLTFAKKVAVGARVNHNILDGSTGTVTVVHPDGTVSVKWDRIGQTDSYTVGTARDVTLI